METIQESQSNYHGQIGIVVVGPNERKSQPSFYAVDLELLMRLHWRARFDPTRALRCEYNRTIQERNSKIEEEDGVRCFPQYDWIGIKRVEYSTLPGSLSNHVDIPSPGKELWILYKNDAGLYTQIWQKRISACGSWDKQASRLCLFPVTLPLGTKNSFARFIYFDDSSSDIIRFPVNN